MRCVTADYDAYISELGFYGEGGFYRIFRKPKEITNAEDALVWAVELANERHLIITNVRELFTAFSCL